MARRLLLAIGILFAFTPMLAVLIIQFGQIIPTTTIKTVIFGGAIGGLSLLAFSLGVR